MCGFEELAAENDIRETVVRMNKIEETQSHGLQAEATIRLNITKFSYGT